MNKENGKVVVWSIAPDMESGSPEPEILLSNDLLYVAYVVRQGAGVTDSTEYAVVRFSGVLQHTFGYPNDEALGAHPLFPLGLQSYAFNEIVASPHVQELANRNARIFPGSEKIFVQRRHWVVTFHDETLEVIAREAQLLGRGTAKSAAFAIAAYAAQQAVQPDRREDAAPG